MTDWRQRLAPVPPLLLGAIAFALGILALQYLVDVVWLFDVEQRLDLARATAMGQSNAIALWDAALAEVIIPFLFAVLMATAGLALPLAYLLNWRFASRAPTFLVTLRQAFWVGLWATTCTLLQMNRTLNIAVAALLAIVLAIVEFLLQARLQAEEQNG